MGNFAQAIKFVLKWEGGYVNHPADPGGATNIGITQATYDKYRRSKGLPLQSVRKIGQSEVEEIYHERYWKPINGDNLPNSLALAAFDLAVNSGLDTAKRALNAAKGDWRALVAWRIEFLAGLRHFDTFGKGWMRRIAALIRKCASLDDPFANVQRLILLPNKAATPIEKLSVVGDKLYIATKKTS